MSSLEFWAGVIAVLVGLLANMYQSYQARKASEDAAKAQTPLTNAQAESAMGDALDKLGQAYDRALETIKVQIEELILLRPLTLKIVLLEQEKAQTQKDKDDWKRYSQKLVDQLQEHEILPIPFRRYPTNGDSQKVPTITREDIANQAKKDEKNE
jgi:hypothetical protein